MKYCFSFLGSKEYNNPIITVLECNLIKLCPYTDVTRTLRVHHAQQNKSNDNRKPLCIRNYGSGPHLFIPQSLISVHTERRSYANISSAYCRCWTRLRYSV